MAICPKTKISPLNKGKLENPPVMSCVFKYKISEIKGANSLPTICRTIGTKIANPIPVEIPTIIGDNNANGKPPIAHASAINNVFFTPISAYPYPSVTIIKTF